MTMKNPTKITNPKIRKVIKLFIAHCLNTHGLVLYPFQVEIAKKLIRAILLQTGEDIFVQVSRQSGKTEGIVALVEFIMIYISELLERPMRVGIFAPQKEQAKTDFDRLKSSLGESYRGGFEEIVDPEESNAVTLQLSNKSYCYIFPLTETSHPESKTLDVVIYEEANKIKDKEKKDKADPMRSSTNGVSISVGVGGYQTNYFKRGIDKGVNVIKADYTRVIKEKRKMFELTGDEFHLNYERFVTKRLEEQGKEDESFRTQYGLEFLVGGGTFISPKELHKLRGGFEQTLKHDHGVYFGLDTAKSPDRSVLTVKCGKCKRILSWLRLQGDNYEDQFNIFKKRLEGYDEVLFGAIDSTGQGDFMPDLFENNTDFDVLRVKFSLQSKDAMYKNLLVQLRNGATKYPFDGSREMKEFEEEVLELEREYKGEYLSVHHPDDPKAHDDYADSWALAEWAQHHFLDNQPDVRVVSSSPHLDDDDD